MNNSMRSVALATLLGLAGTFIGSFASAADSEAAVAAGKQVAFLYTLKSDGEVVESNTEETPVTYIQGGGQILPALEAELAGLKAGDEKTVALEAANAYGEVRDDAFQEVPLDQLPEDARTEGAVLQAQGYPGPIRVTEVKEEIAILDFNHPLAGKDLEFDVKILSVEDAPPPPAVDAAMPAEPEMPAE